MTMDLGVPSLLEMPPRERRILHSELVKSGLSRARSFQRSEACTGEFPPTADVDTLRRDVAGVAFRALSSAAHQTATFRVE